MGEAGDDVGAELEYRYPVEREALAQDLFMIMLRSLRCGFATRRMTFAMISHIHSK
jgi:hypothetical protein